MIDTPIILSSDHDAINKALITINHGDLVAFPTDTVYGVGALAFNEPAIEKLFLAKLRHMEKAIPILISDPAELDLVTHEPGPYALRLAQRFWPGPLTLVMPRHPALPAILSPQPTIGVRMPAHPVALALLRLTGPLAVTSANLSGQPNTTTAQQVLAQLAGRISLILDGGSSPGGSPSTVVDCTAPEPLILRQGPISLDDILSTLRVITPPFPQQGAGGTEFPIFKD